MSGHLTSSPEITDEQVAAANTRVEYCLTYARTEPRQGTTFGLNGPAIPNAYPGSMPLGDGAWEDPDLLMVVDDEESLIHRWFENAIREAMHEAMEWFRVDGRPLLDPHGGAQDVIHSICGKAAGELADLARSEKGGK